MCDPKKTSTGYFLDGQQMMERIRTERLTDGWRHFIGQDEMQSGDLIEVLHADDWITGRYEAQGLNIIETTPVAFLELDQTNYLKLQDGMLARRPGRYKAQSH